MESTSLTLDLYSCHYTELTDLSIFIISDETFRPCSWKYPPRPRGQLKTVLSSKSFCPNRQLQMGNYNTDAIRV